MIKSFFSQLVNRLFAFQSFRLVNYIVFIVVMLTVLIPVVTPEQIRISVYEESPQTLYSPITIEDKEATERKRQQRASEVADQYKFREEYRSNQALLIQELFDTISLQRKAIKEEEQSESAAVRLLEEQFSGSISEELKPEDWASLLKMNDNNFSVMRDTIISSVQTVMTRQIQLSDLHKSRIEAGVLVQSASLSKSVQNLAVRIAGAYIRPNYFFDAETTRQMRKQVMNEVEPVRIIEGQILVREGEVISQEVYHQLTLAGFAERKVLWKPYVGLICLMAVFLFYFTKFVDRIGETIEDQNRKRFLWTLLVLLGLFTMVIVNLIPGPTLVSYAFVVPVAFGAMTIRLAIGREYVLPYAIVMGMLGGLIFYEGTPGNFQLVVGGNYFISSVVAGTIRTERQPKMSIMRTSTQIAIVQALFLVSMYMLKNSAMEPQYIGLIISSALITGVLCFVLTIGFLPIVEDVLYILTTDKLIQLTNPSAPLIKQLLTEAPGTYHHSLMVANLSEAACEAIGANGLLARTASYYHDIGKTVRPVCFIENQSHYPNPHASFDAYTSMDIIRAHVSDGVRILKRHGLPKEIVDICAQHHGTSLIRYFYVEACKLDATTNEEAFRYFGPKPQTVEAAVVMIADSCEAAVRSMKQPTSEAVVRLVEKIVVEKLTDGQFNECPITIQQLSTVQEVIIDSLSGLFHERIEYPALPNEANEKG
ncbi:MAG: HD family phosphohydrolase [Bacilli bacterium]